MKTRLIVDGEAVIVPKVSPRVKTYKKEQQLAMHEEIEQAIETTELGQSLKELNSDEIDLSTRMSGIDMRTRLNYIEVPSILAVDSLVSFQFLPVSCLPFTRIKKRLNVSLGGLGRQEIVTTVAGKREQDRDMGQTSFFGKIKGLFTGGQKE